MSKTIIAVKHFALDGRESLETAVKTSAQEYYLRKSVCALGMESRLYCYRGLSTV